MGLGVLDHLLDLGLGKAGRGLDPDLLLLAGAKVLGAHVHDTVGIDVEGDLDLRNSSGSGGDSDQVELAKSPVLAGKLPLSLQDMDRDGGLTIGCGGEDLALLGGDRRVPLDELRVHAAKRLDAEGKRCDIQKQDVLDVSLEDTSLDRGADRDDLIGVDSLVRVLLEQVLDKLLDRGDSRGSTYEDDLVDVIGRDSSIPHGVDARGLGLLDDRGDHLLELRPGKRHLQVLGACGVRRDEGQVDVGVLRGRKRDLGVLGGLLQSLERHLVLRQVDSRLVPEALDHPVDQHLVDVVATQMGVAVGRLDLEDAIAQLEDRDVERTATKIVDGDRLILGGVLSESVCQSRGGGFVDDSLDLETRDPAGVLRGLSLRIVEVCRDGDDGFGDGLPEIVLRGLLHLHQDLGGDLLRAEELAADVHLDLIACSGDDLVGDQLGLLRHLMVLASHEPLDGEHGVLRIRYHLVLRRAADDTLALALVADDGRRRPVPLCICDDLGLIAFHDGNAAVGGSKVDSDYLSHCLFLSYQYLIYVVFPTRKLM